MSARMEEDSLTLESFDGRRRLREDATARNIALAGNASMVLLESDDSPFAYLVHRRISGGWRVTTFDRRPSRCGCGQHPPGWDPSGHMTVDSREDGIALASGLWMKRYGPPLGDPSFFVTRTMDDARGGAA